MNPDDATVTAGPTALQAGRQFGVYRVEALLGFGQPNRMQLPA